MRILITHIVTFIIVFSIAISNPLDSIIVELENTNEDTKKIELLNEIACKYSSKNPKLGLEYGERAVKLSMDTDYDEGLASSYNYMGINNSVLGNYYKSNEYFKKALGIYRKLNDSLGISQQLSRLGIISNYQSKFVESLNYHQQSLNIAEKIQNQKRIAKQLGNIGTIYNNLKEYDKARIYFQRALEIQNELGDKKSISRQLGNIALSYNYLKKFDKALEYYSRAYEIDEELHNEKGKAIRLGNIGIVYRYTGDYDKAMNYYKQALAKNREIGSKDGEAINLASIGELHFHLAQDSVYSKIKNTTLNLDKAYNYKKALEYSENAKELSLKIGAKRPLVEMYEVLDKSNYQLGNYKQAHQYQSNWVELKDSIFSVGKTTEIASLEAKKQKELNEKELKLVDLRLTRKDNERLALILGILLFVVALIVIILQRRKSEKLLLNILPPKIAKRLKRNEKNIANKFNDVSVVFLDIVGFTAYSKVTDPKLVVKALNDIFTKFDNLSEKHKLEKIKTIGDCYMAVSGLPEPNSNHALAAARFALEAKEVVKNYQTPDGQKLQFRIGIDTGPVVAGVIGTSKFIYDLWGDAVNTASRMENAGLPGEIQITEEFKKKVEIMNIQIIDRGELEVKGKGIINTYLIK
jgi:adenylate cyclase